jgi:hypothetical protein
VSKRHLSQQRRRGYGHRGPRYSVQQSRVSEKHDFRRGRTEKLYWYVVMDQETDQPASEEFTDQSHARQLADRLNGRPDQPAPEKQRIASHRPLRRQIEAILEAAGCLTGGCTRHRTPPMVTLHTDKDGSVLIRSVRFDGTLSNPAVPESDRMSAWWVQRCVAPLTKAGLFVSEGRDGQGPFLRATKL